jgi:hypothetical protein
MEIWGRPVIEVKSLRHVKCEMCGSCVVSVVSRPQVKITENLMLCTPEYVFVFCDWLFMDVGLLEYRLTPYSRSAQRHGP